MGGMGGMGGPPPALFLRSDGDEAGPAAAAAAPAQPAAKGSKGAAKGGKGGKQKEGDAAAAAPRGVQVDVGAWKVEQIDAFLEAMIRSS